MDECAAMLDWIDREGRRRLALQKEHGAENIDMLPAGIRPPRIIVFLDEFVSLLELSKGVRRNPTGDPDVDNMIMMDAWRDRLKRRIGASVSHILTQHRSQGITMILGSQMMKAESMDALPDAGLAKNQMGRLFVGAGDVIGNVSAQNVREGNRLIRQALLLAYRGLTSCVARSRFGFRDGGTASIPLPKACTRPTPRWARIRRSWRVGESSSRWPGSPVGCTSW